MSTSVAEAYRPLSIGSFGLNPCFVTALGSRGIFLVEDLESLTEEELRSIRGIGIKGFAEVTALLKSAQISLKSVAT